MQTTYADFAAGIHAYQAWAKRFRHSAMVARDSGSSSLYLAHYSEATDAFGDHHISDDAVEQKIAFMAAYLGMVALESKQFEISAKHLLKMQGRLKAPKIYGVWLYQANAAEFGAGTSTLFQGDWISLFCENVKQLDFADISGILPFDNIMIRKPEGYWTPKELVKTAEHIKWDLGFDGHDTEIQSHHMGEWAFMTLLSPDHGIGAGDTKRSPKRQASSKARPTSRGK